MLLLLLAGVGVAGGTGGGVPDNVFTLAPVRRTRYGWPEQPEAPLRVHEVVYRATPSSVGARTKAARSYVDTRLGAAASFDAFTYPVAILSQAILATAPSVIAAPVSKPAALFVLSRMDLVEERQGIMVAEMRRDRFVRQNAEEEMMLLGFASEVRLTPLRAPPVTVVEREPVLLSLDEAPEANIHCPTCRSRLPVSRRYSETVVFCRGCKHEIQVRDLTAIVL